MQQPAWARRLDDRADQLLKRRLGFGIVSGPEPTLGKQLLIVVVAAGAVSVVLAVALIVSGQGERAPILAGPLIGVMIGTVIGRLIKDRRKRR